jgi:hypothetical protein
LPFVSFTGYSKDKSKINEASLARIAGNGMGPQWAILFAAWVPDFYFDEAT